MFLDYRTPFIRMAQDYDVVFIREGEQVVIPCLVSVEDLNVTLYTVSISTHTYSPTLYCKKCTSTNVTFYFQGAISIWANSK